MNAVDLSGKRVLVTGGSMGLGLACAESCLEAGASVVIAARTQSALTESRDQLRRQGYANVHSAVVDVTEPGQVTALFDEAVARLGGVDAVIHCAGVYGPIGPVVDVDPAAWLEAIRVNLFGTFVVARQACSHLLQSGGGNVVLFSGGGAATPFPNFTAYACSKVAVVRLTESLAEEMRPHNVQVNCVAPGFVITRLHQDTLAAGERAGKAFLENTKRQIETGGVPPSVGAGCARFLISDAARGITGKFVAAPYDGWAKWPERLSELQGSDVFTLRRIVPKDRGAAWQ